MSCFSVDVVCISGCIFVVFSVNRHRESVLLSNKLPKHCTLTMSLLSPFSLILTTAYAAPWFDHKERMRMLVSSSRTLTPSLRKNPLHANKNNIELSISSSSSSNSISSMVKGKAKKKKKKKQSKKMKKKLKEKKLSESDDRCCKGFNLGVQQSRQKSSVLRFVYHSPVLFLSFKPVLVCDYHVAYLYFRSIDLAILSCLAALSIIPKNQSIWRLILGSVLVIGYIFVLLKFKPFRRTKSWKFPARLLVLFVSLLALVLNYISAIVDENGQHWYVTINILSFAVVGLSCLLIVIVLPISAVIELIIGVRNDRKMIKLKAGERSEGAVLFGCLVVVVVVFSCCF